MPIIMNGTTIPEDVASVFNFNGTDIKEVFFNGVRVWLQQLFSSTWSGNSIATTAQSLSIGLEVSGGSCRFTMSTYGVGAWISSNSNGTFSGASSLINDYGIITEPDGRGFKYRHEGVTSTTAITFTISGGWVGTSLNADNNTGFYTSGGSLKYSYFGVNGAWITLT